jgi:hypothetical protein
MAQHGRRPAYTCCAVEGPVAGAQERCSAGRRGAGARGAARQGGRVRNRGQARSSDTMRVDESWRRMG